MDAEKENTKKDLTPDEQVEMLVASLLENFCEHPNEKTEILLADILSKIPKTGWKRDDNDDDHRDDPNLKAHYIFEIDNKEGPDDILTINVWWRGDFEFENYLLQLTQNPNVPPTSPEIIDMHNKPTGATLVIQTEDGNIYNFAPKPKSEIINK